MIRYRPSLPKFTLMNYSVEDSFYCGKGRWMRVKVSSSVSYCIKSYALMYNRVVSLMKFGAINGVNLTSDDSAGLKNTFLRIYWSYAMNSNMFCGYLRFWCSGLRSDRATIRLKGKYFCDFLFIKFKYFLSFNYQWPIHYN